MKVKTALIILFSILILGLIGLSVVYQEKKNQIADVPVQKVETPAPVPVLTNDQKEEIGKKRAAELLRMMDENNGASSTPLTKEEEIKKIKEGEARAASLLRMMK